RPVLLAGRAGAFEPVLLFQLRQPLRLLYSREYRAIILCHFLALFYVFDGTHYNVPATEISENNIEKISGRMWHSYEWYDFWATSKQLSLQNTTFGQLGHANGMAHLEKPQTIASWFLFSTRRHLALLSVTLYRRCLGYPRARQRRMSVSASSWSPTWFRAADRDTKGSSEIVLRMTRKRNIAERDEQSQEHSLAVVKAESRLVPTLLLKGIRSFALEKISKFAKKVAPSSGFRCLFSNWGLILNITSSGYKKVVKTVTEFERQVE
ncbi:hypothetical protein MSG28_000179, partial [Choristoneura fumiferana]